MHPKRRWASVTVFKKLRKNISPVRNTSLLRSLDHRRSVVFLSLSIAMFSNVIFITPCLAQDISGPEKKEKCSGTGMLMRYVEDKKEWMPTYKSCRKSTERDLGANGSNVKRCRGGRDWAYSVESQRWQQVYNPCLTRE